MKENLSSGLDDDSQNLQTSRSHSAVHEKTVAQKQNIPYVKSKTSIKNIKG